MPDHLEEVVLVRVPRVFERVLARIRGQMGKQSSLKRALFRMTTAVGWRRLERQQRRA